MNEFEIIPLRGEFTIVRRGEVVYRSRCTERAETLMPALRSAFERGLRERLHGWPDESPPRSPIWDMVVTGFEPYGFHIWERHRRFPMGDKLVYRTGGEVDATMALAALRRAGTLGALSLGAIDPPLKPRSSRPFSQLVA